MPKDNYLQGKYGMKGAYEQYKTAITSLCIYMEYLDQNQFTKLSRYIEQNNLNTRLLQKKATTKSGVEFQHTFATNDAAKQSKKRLKQLKKDMTRLKANPPAHFNDFEGYLMLAEKLIDPDAGDYGRALAENPILSNILSVFNGGPKVKAGDTLDNTIKNLSTHSPKTNQLKEGPLGPLNEFFKGAAKLIDLEYERQGIADHYDKNKEAEYMNKLGQVYTQMIESQKKIDALVGPDGKSEYDPYLQNPLDIMAGKDLKKGESQRNARKSVANMQGQLEAINNGWNMFELDMCGQISELAFYYERAKKQMVSKLNPERLKTLEQNQQQNIAQKKAALQTAVEEIKKAQDELNKLKTNKASQQKISEKEEEVNAKKATAQTAAEYYATAVQQRETSKDNRVKERKKLQRYDMLSRKFNALSQKVKNTNGSYISDKNHIKEEFMAILNENLANPESDAADKKLFNKAKIYTNAAMANYGRRPGEYEQVDEEAAKEILTEDMYKQYNGTSMINSKHAPAINLNDLSSAHLNVDPMIVVVNEREEILNNNYNANIDDIKGPVKYTTPIRNAGWYQFEYKLDDEFGNNTKKIEKAMNDTASVAMRKLTNLHQSLLENETYPGKDYRRIYQIYSKMGDETRGNLMQAFCENPVLNSLFAQMNGSIPKIHVDSVNSEDVQNWMRENHIEEQMIRFAESSKDLFEAEFAKQQMRKTGWNDAKEKIYLAKFLDAAKRNLDSFDKLAAVPTDIQANKKYLNLELNQITGMNSETGSRDSAAVKVGLEWAVKGIENGWTSEYLSVLQAGGWLEGAVLRHQKKLEVYLEKSVSKKNNNPKTAQEINAEEDRAQLEAQTRKQLQTIQEWKEKHLNPFKERIMNRKINSPADILESITEIKDFYNKHKEDSFVRSRKIGSSQVDENLFIEFQGAMPYLLPTLANRCIKELETAKAKGIDLSKVSKPAPVFKILDRSELTKTYADALRTKKELQNNEEIAPEARLIFVQEALKARFFHGMIMEANPEFFDRNHPDYATYDRKLNDYCTQLAKRVLTVCEGSTDKEIADIVEYGNFNSEFSEIKDRLEADAAKARFDAFIVGRPERNKKDKLLTQAMEDMKNSPAKWGSSSGLYDNILSDLKKLVKMRAELSKELMSKYRTDFSYKVKGNNDIEFVLPKEIKVEDANKLQKYIDKHKSILADMNRYLSGKDKIIREKGGNPEEIGSAHLLGTNGERRYNSMKNAKKALINEYNSAVEFGNKGPSDIQRIIRKKKSFEDFINEPKPRINDYIYPQFKDSFDVGTDMQNPEKYDKAAYDAAMRQYENARKEFLGKEKAHLMLKAKYSVADTFKQTLDQYDRMLEDEKQVRWKLNEEAKQLEKAEIRLKSREMKEKTFEAAKAQLDAKKAENAKKTEESVVRSDFIKSTKEKLLGRKVDLYRKPVEVYFNQRMIEKTAEKKQEMDTKLNELREKYKDALRLHEETGDALPQNIKKEFDDARKPYEDAVEAIHKEKAKAFEDLNKGVDLKIAVENVKYEDLIKEANEANKALNNIKTKGVHKIMEEQKIAPKKAQPAKDDFGVGMKKDGNVKNPADIKVPAAGVKVPQAPKAGGPHL